MCVMGLDGSWSWGGLDEGDSGTVALPAAQHSQWQWQGQAGGKGPSREPRSLPGLAAGWWCSPASSASPLGWVQRLILGWLLQTHPKIGVQPHPCPIQAAGAEPRLGLAAEVPSGLDVVDEE